MDGQTYMHVLFSAYIYVCSFTYGPSSLPLTYRRRRRRRRARAF